MAPQTVFPGERYGQLVVLEYVKTDPTRGRYFRCRCDCGGTTVITAGGLGSTRSCGCLKGFKKHGHSPRGKSSSTYSSWEAMVARCHSLSHPRYPEWGGRGIVVCERWREFKNFLADMGERPEGRTLDRIDNDGNYEPGNCQWATPAQQVRKQAKTKLSIEIAREIRARYAAGEVSQRELAAEFGTHAPIVSRIVNNKCWREDE